MAKQVTEIDKGKRTRSNSTPSSRSTPRPKVLGGPKDTRKKLSATRKRHGLTDDSLKGIPQISHILKAAQDGIEGCIQALRGDEDEVSHQFLEKWDSISETDRKFLSIDEICLLSGIPPRRLVEVVTGALMSQGDSVTQIVVASSKPRIIAKMAEMATSALGSMDRDMFLKGKSVDWFPAPKGVVIDNRTQNNTLNTSSEPERALPPPTTDRFLLDLQSKMTPQKQIEAPQPTVVATIPEVEYIEGDVR